MANKKLFAPAQNTKIVPPATTVNEAGGRAYAMDSEWALAQIAFTGTFNSVFYGDAESQLTELTAHAEKVSDLYLAQLAVASRTVGYMKAMPPALLLILAKRNMPMAKQIFNRVVDAPNILKDLFTMTLSGRFGRRRLGYALQRQFKQKLWNAAPSWLINLSIGTQPSIRDIFRLAKPKPRTKEQRAAWGYLLGQDQTRWGEGVSKEDMPPMFRALDAFNRAEREDTQVELAPSLKGIRWEALSGSIKGQKVWKALIANMKAQALRMNLNTMQRHGLFADQEMVQYVADRLGDISEVQGSRQFPYQYLSAYMHLDDAIPQQVRSGLQKAAEAACGNIPKFGCPAVIMVDTSGSMSSCPVTGGFREAGKEQKPSKVMAIHAASLFGVAAWRANPGSVLLPFDTQVHEHKLDPDDSLLSLTQRLSKYGGGGTDCSSALAYANTKLKDRKFGVAILVSDNESWADRPCFGNRGTGVMHEFEIFRKNQQRLGMPNAKLVCMDLYPGATSQVPNTEHSFCVGGFSDGVFELLGQFVNGDRQRFVDRVKAAYDPSSD